MPRRFVDISVALEAGIASDAPGFEPGIEYLDHRRTAADVCRFFPGFTPAHLPGGEGLGDLAPGRDHAQRHAPRRPLPFPLDEARDEVEDHLTASMRPDVAANLPKFFGRARRDAAWDSPSTASARPRRRCRQTAPTASIRSSATTGTRPTATASSMISRTPERDAPLRHHSVSRLIARPQGLPGRASGSSRVKPNCTVPVLASARTYLDEARHRERPKPRSNPGRAPVWIATTASRCRDDELMEHECTASRRAGRVIGQDASQPRALHGLPRRPRSRAYPAVLVVDSPQRLSRLRQPWSRLRKSPTLSKTT
jgi:hypothetical protein